MSQGTTVSNSNDTDQDQHSVIPDLGQNCLQTLKGYPLSADDKKLPFMVWLVLAIQITDFFRNHKL